MESSESSETFPAVMELIVGIVGKFYRIVIVGKFYGIVGIVGLGFYGIVGLG